MQAAPSREGRVIPLKVWLRPVLMCRISHDSWTAGNLLKAPEFQKLLQEVNVDAR